MHMPHYSGPNQIIARAERTIDDACEGAEVIFIMRIGDRITLRHTQTGDEPISDNLVSVYCGNLLAQIFPRKGSPP
jgi:hypothetical protein